MDRLHLIGPYRSLEGSVLFCLLRDAQEFHSEEAANSLCTRGARLVKLVPGVSEESVRSGVLGFSVGPGTDSS